MASIRQACCNDHVSNHNIVNTCSFRKTAKGYIPYWNVIKFSLLGTHLQYFKLTVSPNRFSK